MVFAIALIIVVVLLLLLGTAPMIRRFGTASEDQMKARLSSRRLDAERDFEPPRNEGDLL
jgi:flagellar biosynthesis/type III secretory pathway M-ring protein FliF/YscJ